MHGIAIKLFAVLLWLSSAVNAATIVFPSQGGTGVSNNNAATITRSGSHALTLTTSGTTNATLPSGSTTLLYSGGPLGTPSSGTLTSATGLPISTGVSGLGANVATALGVAIGSAGAPVTFNGAGGTPSSILLTNATGTAAGLTVGAVTTNANLTGPITSTGNATAVAAQTGTGSTFAMQASPLLTGVVTITNVGTTLALASTNASGTYMSFASSGGLKAYVGTADQLMGGGSANDAIVDSPGGNVIIATAEVARGTFSSTGLVMTGAISATTTGAMPLYGTTGTGVNAPHMVTGGCTLAAGTCTVNFTNAAIFASSGSYVCHGNDTSGSALAVSVQNQSGSQITIFGTLTSTVTFICTGN